MRYAIVSDIHANLEAARAALDKIDEIGADQIVCLGDVVGYNANPNECCDLIRSRDIPTVCGNHDAVACGLEEPWGFNPVALSAAMWTRDTLREDNLKWLRGLPDVQKFDSFLAVHGSRPTATPISSPGRTSSPIYPMLRNRIVRSVSSDIRIVLVYSRKTGCTP